MLFHVLKRAYENIMNCRNGGRFSVNYFGFLVLILSSLFFVLGVLNP
jgi:hypothetical protein